MTYGRRSVDLDGVPRRAKLYMGLSGGIDSAYLGWRLLQAGHPMLFVYVSYRTAQRRWPHEDEAHQAVLDWYRTQGLRNFEYLYAGEVSFRRSIGYWFLDHEYLYGFLAGAHLRAKARQDIRFLADSGHKNSRNRQDRTYRRIWRQLNIVAEREITVVFPLHNFTKAQILNDAPPELVARTWSCRRPRGDQPCGKCSTCIDIQQARRRSA